MRFIFALGILQSSSLLTATTINAGTFGAPTILGNSFWTSRGTSYATAAAGLLGLALLRQRKR